MPEVRQSVPSVARFKYTIRPTTQTVQIGETQDGKPRYVDQLEFPGVLVEIIPYVGELPMPGVVEEFRSKKFIQDWLADLKAISAPTEEDKLAIRNLESFLAKPETIWLEDVLQAAGITDLEQTFASAYSDALDEFPHLKEPNSPISGLPYYLGAIQWDAKLYWNGEKSVVLRSGFYENDQLEGRHVVIETKFESGDTRRSRIASIASIQSQLTQAEENLVKLNRIVELKAMTQTPEVLEELATFNPQIVNSTTLENDVIVTTQDVASRQRQLSDLQKVTYGDLGELLANPSLVVLPSISLATFQTLKAKRARWASLDLDMVASKYRLPPVD